VRRSSGRPVELAVVDTDGTTAILSGGTPSSPYRFARCWLSTTTQSVSLSAGSSGAARSWCAELGAPRRRSDPWVEREGGPGKTTYEDRETLDQHVGLVREVATQARGIGQPLEEEPGALERSRKRSMRSRE
jgi:hypothetical protein